MAPGGVLGRRLDTAPRLLQQVQEAVKRQQVLQQWRLQQHRQSMQHHRRRAFRPFQPSMSTPGCDVMRGLQVMLWDMRSLTQPEASHI
jgi:hypothetical protein